jgi:uncharacterized membrane protein HdeD (DUF308 family)
MMVQLLKTAWWMLLLRGIAAILFALLLLFQPQLTLAAYVIVFAIYTLADGISTIAGSLTRREGQWFLVLLWGVVSVIAGLVALGNPLLFGALTVTIMVYIVAVWSVVGGIVQVIAAIQLRREIEGEWLLAVNGILSVLFGVLLVRFPIETIDVLLFLTAFYAAVAGVIQIILAFRVRGLADNLDELKESLTQS